jgi:2-hydroxyacyl-CoA lyase 1
VGLVGDAQAIVGQLVSGAAGAPFPTWASWKAQLAKEVAKNNAVVSQLMSNDNVPMSYYRVFRTVRECIPADAVIVSEGANVRRREGRAHAC